jgi:8-hydroxy-5-deazaflavin:NADPH oxidoreductase
LAINKARLALAKHHRKDSDSTMKVAIIGAGNVGKALATSITNAGHDVTIAASSAENARAAADEIGTRAADSSASAVVGADVVILAIPYAAGAQVAADIRDGVAGKTIIDVSNPLTPDYSGLATTGTSAAEELQQRLPQASVVKAFNTLFASIQAAPTREVDGLVAADDGDAKQQVISLIESMGFTPLDVGPLSAARHLEGMAFINIGLNAQNGWSWTSAWKLER